MSLTLKCHVIITITLYKKKAFTFNLVIHLKQEMKDKFHFLLCLSILITWLFFFYASFVSEFSFLHSHIFR